MWRAVCRVRSSDDVHKRPARGELPAGPTILQNYLSVGVDAQVVLEFHRSRARHPGLFASRAFNKLKAVQDRGRYMFINTLIPP